MRCSACCHENPDGAKFSTPTSGVPRIGPVADDPHPRRARQKARESRRWWTASRNGCSDGLHRSSAPLTRSRRMVVVLSAMAIVAAGTRVAGAETPDCSANASIKHLVVIFDENVSFDHYF